MAKTNFQIFNEENAPERTYNDSEYKEATQRVGGVMPGMALSRMHNKMYYQWSAMCKAIANLIVNHGHDCMDSDVDGITRYLEEAIVGAATTEITAHRTAAELDHPDGSVTTKKLSDAAVTGAKIADGVIEKKHLTAAMMSAISDAGIAILQRSKTYAVGDIAYHKALPSWARLECVKAGTTGATLPTQIEQMVQNGGGIVTDGTVVWIIDDLRDGTPVGAVRGSLYLPAGYVKANGATVQRADYPRLVALADRHNLWTDDVTANAGLFGRGDGSATMVLPNWTDRMVQLAGDNAGASVAAGLPNITGKIKNRDTVGEKAYWQFLADSNVLDYGALFCGERVNHTAITDMGGLMAATPNSIDFDASRANPIYGRSNTVQPAATKLIPVIKY